MSSALLTHPDQDAEERELRQAVHAHVRWSRSRPSSSPLPTFRAEPDHTMVSTEPFVKSIVMGVLSFVWVAIVDPILHLTWVPHSEAVAFKTVERISRWPIFKHLIAKPLDAAVLPLVNPTIVRFARQAWESETVQEKRAQVRESIAEPVAMKFAERELEGASKRGVFTRNTVGFSALTAAIVAGINYVAPILLHQPPVAPLEAILEIFEPAELASILGPSTGFGWYAALHRDHELKEEYDEAHAEPKSPRLPRLRRQLSNAREVLRDSPVSTGWKRMFSSSHSELPEVEPPASHELPEDPGRAYLANPFRKGPYGELSPDWALQLADNLLSADVGEDEQQRYLHTTVDSADAKFKRLRFKLATAIRRSTYIHWDTATILCVSDYGTIRNRGAEEQVADALHAAREHLRDTTGENVDVEHARLNEFSPNLAAYIEAIDAHEEEVRNNKSDESVPHWKRFWTRVGLAAMVPTIAGSAMFSPSVAATQPPPPPTTTQYDGSLTQQQSGPSTADISAQRAAAAAATKARQEQLRQQHVIQEAADREFVEDSATTMRDTPLHRGSDRVQGQRYRAIQIEAAEKAIGLAEEERVHGDDAAAKQDAKDAYWAATRADWGRQFAENIGEDVELTVAAYANGDAPADAVLQTLEHERTLGF